MKIRCMQCMEIYDDEYDVCPHCGFVRGTAPDEVYHLKTETMLRGRYSVGVVVGFGGFGITYKAWDTQLEKVVAVKEYYPSGLVNRASDGINVRLYAEKARDEFSIGLERFLDEARSTAKFGQHPNIVNVYDFFEENGTGYIVMEFLDGISLKEYLKMNGGMLDIETSTNILLSVIEALKVIHKEKILHRDISPDNIFICIPDKVKLIDFGAARISDGEQEKTMSIVLKPGYAPPEQYRSKSKQGPWTDIYALGATMYQMVTGVVPTESVNRVVEDDVKEPYELNPKIPEYLSNAIMMAMALNQDLRFQNVTQFEEAILHQRKVLSLKADLKRRKRKRVLSLSIITGVIAAGTAISLFVYNKMKFSAELKEATVDVWIPVDSESTLYSETAFLSRIQNFTTDYPHITVNVEEVPSDQYYDKLQAAAKQDALPDLFISTEANDELLACTCKLNDVFRVADKNEYYLFDQYSDYFPEKNQMPTGIKIALGFKSTLDVDNSTNDFEAFVSGESMYYVASTGSEYAEVQDRFAGQYEVVVDLPRLENGIMACFTEAWSVSNQGSDEEQAAATRIICYLLSETSEDIFYVQNEGGTPLNKKVFADYVDVNWELDAIQAYVDNFVIDKENLFDLQEYCDEEYNALIKEN